MVGFLVCERYTKSEYVRICLGRALNIILGSKYARILNMAEF